jgi:acetate---CoA ligase (ADP-forming)
MTALVPSVGTPAPVPAAESGLQALFAPRGIAVVGASRDSAKLGAVMARSLARFGGPVALINPREPSMTASVAAAAQQHPVDLAILCVPAAASPSALAEAAGAGAKAAIVCGGGFAETGTEGERWQAALTDVAVRTGIRVLGPNTSGCFVPALGLTATFVPGAADVPPGQISIVAASGGVNHALAFLLAEAGYGVSLGVGLGNAIDIAAPDVLDHLANDPATTAVALHLESVADGPRLLAAVWRLTLHKPVVALVVGRHDVSAFAQSHTGALATSWRTIRAALRQAGAVLVDSERELLDAVTALSLVRLPAGAQGVGVLTAQAGPGLLLLDDLHGRGAAVPELSAATRSVISDLLPPMTYQNNPVDTGRPGPAFAGVLRALAADPQVDIIGGYALYEPDALDPVAAVDEAKTAVPVVLGIGGSGGPARAARRALARRGVPAPADPSGVAAAIGALLEDARLRRRKTFERASAAPITVELGEGPWDEAAAKSIMEALGMSAPGRRVCADRAAAHTALEELGGPVAVKLLDSAVLHKTEVGGVHLGVRSSGELDAALDALERIGARQVLVEAMAPAGVDLVVGARRDPVFGPVVLVGLGGTVAEALADVSVRVAPITPDEASGMVDDLTGRALLDGWRGGPVLDRLALGEFVAALGGLLSAHPEILELEVNPLRVTAAGLVVLDAVIITDREDHDGQSHS